MSDSPETTQTHFVTPPESVVKFNGTAVSNDEEVPKGNDSVGDAIDLTDRDSSKDALHSSRAVSPNYPPMLDSQVLFLYPFTDLGYSFLPTVPQHEPPIPTTPFQPKFSFTAEMLEEARAQVSYAFSLTSQIGSVYALDHLMRGETESTSFKTIVPEPMISICYPGRGCHDPVDSFIKLVAEEQQCDIIVIDALHLAMGHAGPLGFVASDAIYTSTDSSAFYAALSVRAQNAIDHLVNLAQNGSDLNEPSVERPPRKRIIYIRAFESAAQFSETILLRFIRAIHTRRVANLTRNEYGRFDSSSFHLLQPTVLVLGCTDTNDHYAHVDESRFSGHHRYTELHNSGGSKTHLSTIKNQVFKPYDATDKLAYTLSDFSASFFLSSLAPDVDTSRYSIYSDIQFSYSDFDLSTAPGHISVHSCAIEGMSLPEAELAMYQARRAQLANAWLQMCLTHKGASLIDHPPKPTSDGSSEASTKIQEEDTPLPSMTQVLGGLDGIRGTNLLRSLDHVARLAVGLSDYKEYYSVRVSREVLARAYRLVVSTAKTRDTWLNPVAEVLQEEQEEDKKEKEEGDDVDDISLAVKKVREASDLSEGEKKMLGCIVDPVELQTTFKDVCVSPQIVETFRNIVSLPLVYPQAFQSGLLSKEVTGGVLLYGPPGTGKTHLCRAVAQECGACMLYAKPSELLNMWLGNSEQQIAGLFSLANRLAPCLIFIDEVDSCFAKRVEDNRSWERSILSEFLQSMDGLRTGKRKGAGVVVVGASNRPQDIDHAVLRRLPNRMMMDLPNELEREEILNLYLRDEPLSDSVNLKEMARALKNYSGSDIKNVCVFAAMQAVKEAIGEIDWSIPKRRSKTVSEEADSKPDPIASKLSQRKITTAHLERGMKAVPASTAHEAHNELRQWHGQFGKTHGNVPSPSEPTSSTAPAHYREEGSFKDRKTLTNGSVARTTAYNSRNVEDLPSYLRPRKVIPQPAPS